jgi:predicted ribosomally synthesized peptide with nif11-like leader
MSAEAARELIERMKSDEAFRAEVMAGAHPEGRMAVIRAAGFDCTAEEIAAQAEVIDDTDLDAVAGGKATYDCWCLHPPASPGWDL